MGCIGGWRSSGHAKAFRSRSARKIYWALVAGVPRPHQGRISTYLAKGGGPDGERMRVAKHGEEGADHAITYYDPKARLDAGHSTNIMEKREKAGAAPAANH